MEQLKQTGLWRSWTKNGEIIATHHIKAFDIIFLVVHDLPFSTIEPGYTVIRFSKGAILKNQGVSWIASPEFRGSANDCIIHLLKRIG